MVQRVYVIHIRNTKSNDSNDIQGMSMANRHLYQITIFVQQYNRD